MNCCRSSAVISYEWLNSMTFADILFENMLLVVNFVHRSIGIPMRLPMSIFIDDEDVQGFEIAV